MKFTEFKKKECCEAASSYFTAAVNAEMMHNAEVRVFAKLIFMTQTIIPATVPLADRVISAAGLKEICRLSIMLLIPYCKIYRLL